MRTTICAECIIIVAPVPEVACICTTCIGCCSLEEAEPPHPPSMPKDRHVIAQGELKLHIEYIYPLSQAAQAHRDLEGRKTSGKILLIP